jgi:hypothetical protein
MLSSASAELAKYIALTKKISVPPDERMKDSRIENNTKSMCSIIKYKLKPYTHLKVQQCKCRAGQVYRARREDKCAPRGADERLEH